MSKLDVLVRSGSRDTAFGWFIIFSAGPARIDIKLAEVLCERSKLSFKIRFCSCSRATVARKEIYQSMRHFLFAAHFARPPPFLSGIAPAVLASCPEGACCLRCFVKRVVSIPTPV